MYTTLNVKCPEPSLAGHPEIRTPIIGHYCYPKFHIIVYILTPEMRTLL